MLTFAPSGLLVEMAKAFAVPPNEKDPQQVWLAIRSEAVASLGEPDSVVSQSRTRQSNVTMVIANWRRRGGQCARLFVVDRSEFEAVWAPPYTNAYLFVQQRCPDSASVNSTPD